MAATGAIPTTAIDSHLASINAPAAITTYQPLAEGDDGTFQSLDAMRGAVLYGLPPEYSGYQDEFNIRAARSICAGVPGQDARAQIAALFDFVAHKINYLDHPWNTQVVQDAKRTMELGSGDCVSLSTLLATLLASLGYESWFVAQWPAGEFASHVYVECTLSNGEVIALDAVASDQPMGWRQSLLDGGFEVQWKIFD